MYKILRNLFYFLSLLFLVHGSLTFFYKEVEAKTIEANENILRQNSYTGRGLTNGAYFRTTFIKYSYEVEKETIYKGYWLKLGIKYKTKFNNSVFYNPLLPSISVKEKGLPIFWILLFILFGFLFSQINNFFIYLNKRT